MKRELSPWGKLAVIVLTIWGLVVVAPDLTRLWMPLGDLGFSADNNGLIYSVDDTVGKIGKSGLAPGDRIDLAVMNCRHFTSAECVSILSVFGGLGGLQYVRTDSVVTLAVATVGRAHRSSICTPQNFRTLTGAIHRDLVCTFRPDPAMLEPLERLILFFVELAAFAFIGIGAFLVWRRPSLMTWGFFLYGLWFNPGPYFVFYAQLQGHPWLMVIQEILQALFQGAGYAGFLLFALRFPNDQTEPRWRPIERIVPFVGLALFLLQLYSFGNILGIGTASATNATYLAGYAVDILVIIVLFARQHGMSPRDRQRTRWVVWGCSVGLTAFIFADMNEATDIFQYFWPDWSVPEWVLLIFYGANAFVPFAVLHALRSYRVVDVSFAVSRSAILLLLWCVFGGVLALVHQFSVELLPYRQSISTIAIVIMSIILTLLFEKANEKMTHACDAIFFRRLHDAEQRIKRACAALKKSTTFEQIEHLLVSEPATAFALASAALFRNDGTQTFVRVEQAIGWSDGMLSQIDSKEPLITELARSDGVLRWRDTQRLHGAMPKDAAVPEVAVAVMNERRIMAIAFYGAHRRGDGLNREEIAALRSLAEAAAAAYDSVEAQMLRERVEQLSAKLARERPAEA